MSNSNIIALQGLTFEKFAAQNEAIYHFVDFGGVAQLMVGHRNRKHWEEPFVTVDAGALKVVKVEVFRDKEWL